MRSCQFSAFHAAPRELYGAPDVAACELYAAPDAALYELCAVPDAAPSLFGLFGLAGLLGLSGPAGPEVSLAPEPRRLTPLAGWLALRRPMRSLFLKGKMSLDAR